MSEKINALVYSLNEMESRVKKLAWDVDELRANIDTAKERTTAILDAMGEVRLLLDGVVGESDGQYEELLRIEFLQRTTHLRKMHGSEPCTRRFLQSGPHGQPCDPEQ